MQKSENFSILVETADLARILGFASSIVERRNALPILAHIKLEAKDNKLFLTATDMDISICLEMGASVKRDGVTTVHSQTFSDIVRKISDKTISMEYSETSSQLEIRTENYEVNLSTLPPEEFPSMDYFTSKFELVAPAKTIAALLECTKFAISTEETRYNLTGVYLHAAEAEDGKFLLAAAATDGHRLSVYTSGQEVSSEFGVILPRKTIGELYKILKDSAVASSDVKISIGGNRVMFSAGNFILISKLIEGSFPNYKVFIPVSATNILEVPAKLLTSAVDRVSTVAADKFPAIKLTIMDHQLELEAYGEAKGLAHEVIPINGDNVKYEGTQVTIGFNPRYLMDVLSAVGDDLITVMLSDGASPVLVKSQNYPGASFVVMPVKV